MSALDIPPHPRRTARLALGVLAVVAMAGFAEGFLKELAATAPPPPVAGVQASAIAEATPIAPTLQLAEAPRPQRPAAPDADDEAAPALQVAAAPDPAAQAQPAPAADAAATAPEAAASASPAPAPPAPGPNDPPT